MIQDKLGFGLGFDQTILNHPNQQFLCDPLQGNGLPRAQKHCRRSDFAGQLPDDMTSLQSPRAAATAAALSPCS